MDLNSKLIILMSLLLSIALPLRMIEVHQYMLFKTLEYFHEFHATCNSVTFYLIVFHEKSHFLILAGSAFDQI